MVGHLEMQKHLIQRYLLYVDDTIIFVHWIRGTGAALLGLVMFGILLILAGE